MNSRLILIFIFIFSMLFLVFSCVVKRDFDFPPRPEDKAEELFFINGLASTLSLYDPQSGRVYNDLAPIGRAANDLLYYKDSLYIVCSLENEIQIFSESLLSFNGRIKLNPGDNPWALIRIPESSLAYVSCFLSHRLALVDLDQMRQLDVSINTAASPQFGRIMDNKLYLCCSGYNQQSSRFEEGVLMVIDTQNHSLLRQIELGWQSNPQQLALFPQQKEVHVFLSGINEEDDGQVLILDAEDLSEKQRLAIGGSPAWGSSYDAEKQIQYLSGVSRLMSYRLQNDSWKIERGSANPIIDCNGALFEGPVAALYLSSQNQVFCTFFNLDKITVLDADNDYQIIREIEASDGPQSPLLIAE